MGSTNSYFVEPSKKSGLQSARYSAHHFAFSPSSSTNMASVFSLSRSLLSLYFYLSSSLSSVDSLLSLLAIQTKWTNSHLVALALGFCNPYSRRFGLPLKFFRDLSSVGVVWNCKFGVMSGSGGFAVSRTPSGDRLYNSPAMRRHQQLLLQQQQVEQKRHQQQRQLRSEPAAEAEARTNSDDSTLSKPSVCSASPPRPAANVTNIDRLLESNKHVVNEVAIDKIGLGKMVGPRGTAAEHGKHWQEQVQLEGEM